MKPLVAAVLGALLLPASAAAHGADGSRAVAKVTSVSAPGVHATVNDEGILTVRAPSSAVVVIDDAENRPRVRFADGAVYERSTQAARWRRVATGREWSWHEHRAHIEDDELPAAVREHPKQARLIDRWTVTGTIDGKPLRIEGTIRWAPAPGGLGWQWLLVPVVAAMLIYIVYLVLDSRRVTRAQRATA